jgi:hypothetical protein
MDEYGHIEVNEELEADKRTQLQINHFLDNLAYAIYQNDLSCSKDSIKPIPTFDLVQLSSIRSLYNDKLVSIIHPYITTHKNLFIAKSDITKLSDEEFTKIRRNTRKEIWKLTSQSFYVKK